MKRGIELRSPREAKAAAFGVVTVLLYVAVVLSIGRIDIADFGALLRFYLATSLALWMFLGLSWVMIKMYRERPSAGGTGPGPVAVFTTAAVDRWNEDRWVSWVWPPLLFATLLTTFNAFKQMILPLAGYRFDPVIAQVDKTIFLGVEPWRITHAIFASPAATLVIDRAYHGWFVPMSLGLIACAWMPASTFRLRTQYTFTYIGVWVMIGSVLAFAVPSAGPCFYSHLVGPAPQFDELLQRLASTESATGFHLGFVDKGYPEFD